MDLLHETLRATARRCPDRPAVVHAREGALSFGEFAAATGLFARHVQALGVTRDDRIAVYLPKLHLTAIAFYGASLAGAVFVPVNPVLKPAQVAYILRDCNVRVLVTSSDRLQQLAPELAECPDLEHVILSDVPKAPPPIAQPWTPWSEISAREEPARPFPRCIDNDMAAILYTSGSTGKPKGVIISHRNIVTGAKAVSSYLEISERDRLLAVLPFSFDYGLNQLTSAILTGATCVLFDYLLPRDVIKALGTHGITGLAAVPPLWAQLAPLDWPADVQTTLRYITNSGGAMPDKVLAQLRAKLPTTRPFLMYGLTEAFRSTYLPPEMIDERPGSMGKAIPSAEIVVVDAQGRPVGPNEPGELVHRGALVALGYWNDPARTAERFRPAPGQVEGVPLTEIAVWSGDTVRTDEDGYLYFIGRTDGMIKTSGYRVSPEEVEEIAYATGKVAGAAAIGAKHADLGQAIVLVVSPAPGAELTESELREEYVRNVANYMVPAAIVLRSELPHNPNGKIDRRQLAEEYRDSFTGAA